MSDHNKEHHDIPPDQVELEPDQKIEGAAGAENFKKAAGGMAQIREGIYDATRKGRISASFKAVADILKNTG